MDVEQVVLVDESGRATGVHDKQTVHTASTPLHLAFSCYIFDSAGKLLLTRRARSKRTWPGVWTNSCCGHPQPDEAIEDSVVRRARVELGMAVEELSLVLPGFRYRAEMDGVVENELCPVFRARAVDLPVPDTREVADVRWVSWEYFLRRANRRPASLSPWCVEQSHLLAGLGALPLEWPEASPDELPSAAGTRAGRSARSRTH